MATKKKPTKKTTRKTSAGSRAASKKVIKKKVAKKVVVKKKTAKKKRVAPQIASSKTSKAAKETKKKTPRRRRGLSVVEAARSGEVDSKGFVFVNGRRVRLICTDGLTAKRKRRPKATTSDRAAAPKRQLKSPLSAAQLRDFRERLLKYRSGVLHDMGALEKEALEANSGDISHMPIHMADVGSDVYDQDLRLGMAASERQRILEIDDALVRIAKKNYGICQSTGEPIPLPRLRAKPWAKYTKEAAERVERMNRRP